MLAHIRKALEKIFASALISAAFSASSPAATISHSAQQRNQCVASQNDVLPSEFNQRRSLPARAEKAFAWQEQHANSGAWSNCSQYDLRPNWVRCVRTWRACVARAACARVHRASMAAR